MFCKQPNVDKIYKTDALATVPWSGITSWIRSERVFILRKFEIVALNSHSNTMEYSK